MDPQAQKACSSTSASLQTASQRRRLTDCWQITPCRGPGGSPSPELEAASWSERKEKCVPIGVVYGRPWIDQWRPSPASCLQYFRSSLQWFEYMDLVAMVQDLEQPVIISRWLKGGVGERKICCDKVLMCYSMVVPDGSNMAAGRFPCRITVVLSCIQQLCQRSKSSSQASASDQREQSSMWHQIGDWDVRFSSVMPSSCDSLPSKVFFFI